jgi:ribosome-associated toxin RatA of RatAB toxin-antitoxin module
MARTTSDIVIEAPANEIMTVIADFASYPSWATGVQVADVLGVNAQGRPDKVQFVLDAAPIRDEYTLDYLWDGDRNVSWSLDQPGTMLKSMDGTYVLEEIGGNETRVTYKLAVDVSIPLLGMLKRKAEKVIIDTALKGLKSWVESDKPNG